MTVLFSFQMGQLVSKIIKSDLKKNSKDSSDTMVEAQTQTSNIEENDDLQKTPVSDKYLDSNDAVLNVDNQSSTIKILKNLKLDPRSPTIGIYRTPIVIENVKNDNFDSPISIYSTNISSSAVDDIITPIEASVNVSGFEEKNENYELENNQNTTPIRNTSLQVSRKPKTSDAKKYLKDISSNHDKLIKIQKDDLNNDNVCDKENKNLKPLNLKTRLPLSNITSSGNSPRLKQLGKISNRGKIFAEVGSENSSPKINPMIEWDTNNTVII